MASLNKVMLIGRVGRIDIKPIGSGQVASISLATTEKFKNKQGEWTEDTTWHNLSAFGGVVSIIEKYVSKGSQIYVEGRIRKRKYTDREGNEREASEVVVNNIELLDPKPRGDNQSSGEDMGF